MRLSDFVHIKTVREPLGLSIHHAEVTVTTRGRLLWWRKSTERRRIFRRGGGWKFLDTGDYCPGFQAEKLEDQYRAQRLLWEGGGS